MSWERRRNLFSRMGASYRHSILQPPRKACPQFGEARGSPSSACVVVKTRWADPSAQRPSVGEHTRGGRAGELSGSLPLSPHMADKPAGPGKSGNNVSSAAFSSPLPTSLFSQTLSSIPSTRKPPHPFLDLTLGTLWVCPHHSDARLSPSKTLPPGTLSSLRRGPTRGSSVR